MDDLDRVDPGDAEDIVGQVLSAPSRRCACGRDRVVVMTECSSDRQV